LTAKKIGLHRNALAFAPSGYATAQNCNFTGHFSAWNARQSNRNRQLSFLQPEIKAVEAASPNANDHFVRTGDRVGDLAVTECAGRAVSDKLHCFHTG
jgi:hypothetical protein